jgi:uncharacterized OsmC-like protein
MKRLVPFSTAVAALILTWSFMPAQTPAQELATVRVNAQLSSVPARAIGTARTHHFVVDAPPPLGGSNEELNPIEMLLSALATCGVLVSEKVAEEMDVPLTAATADVEGDLDPRGVRGEPVDPRFQAFRVLLTLTGPTAAQADALAGAVRTRCPIYTTLERAAPIELDLQVASPAED